MRISKEVTTSLKGFAILSVVIAHACGFAKAFSRIPLLRDAQFCSMFCQAGMCIFLILSGYGLYASYSGNGLGDFWDKRIAKIILPGTLVNACWFVFTNLKDGIANMPFSSILCIDEDNVVDSTMWYLSYIFFCYVIFYVCFKYFKQWISIVLLIVINFGGRR